jgi:NhaP-type Na+/H+ or K+/H+ antiporter
MLYSFIFAMLIVIVVDEIVGCFPKRHRRFALSCVFGLVFGRVLKWGTEWLIRHYF